MWPSVDRSALTQLVRGAASWRAIFRTKQSKRARHAAECRSRGSAASTGGSHAPRTKTPQGTLTLVPHKAAAIALWLLHRLRAAGAGAAQRDVVNQRHRGGDTLVHVGHRRFPAGGRGRAAHLVAVEILQGGGGGSAGKTNNPTTVSGVPKLPHAADPPGCQGCCGHDGRRDLFQSQR